MWAHIYNASWTNSTYRRNTYRYVLLMSVEIEAIRPGISAYFRSYIRWQFDVYILTTDWQSAGLPTLWRHVCYRLVGGEASMGRGTLISWTWPRQWWRAPVQIVIYPFYLYNRIWIQNRHVFALGKAVTVMERNCQTVNFRPVHERAVSISTKP